MRVPRAPGAAAAERPAGCSWCAAAHTQVARAKALGYEVILVLIHLNNASLNQARIAQRISEGGHHVPAEKVTSHLLNNVQTSLPLCDQVRLVDNSSADNPFLPVATIIAGMDQRHQDPLPPWAHELLRPLGVPPSA